MYINAPLHTEHHTTTECNSYHTHSQLISVSAVWCFIQLKVQQAEREVNSPTCAAFAGLTGSWDPRSLCDFDRDNSAWRGWSSCLFTVTQAVCLWSSWRGARRGPSLSTLLPSWQSLSHKSSRRGEPLLRRVGDDKPANSDPWALSLFPLIVLSSPPPSSPTDSDRGLCVSECGLVNMCCSCFLSTGLLPF